VISKNKIKYIRSLHEKKFREQENLFLVEGIKMINELLESDFRVSEIFATQEAFGQLKLPESRLKPEIISTDELNKISALKHPQGVLAIIAMNENSSIPDISEKLSLALDFIQDPGNMGTIIRICDWFGIETIFCSMNCVDVYNPKTIQATMGAIFRIKIHYVELSEFLKNQSKENGLPVYGTFLDGENIYNEALSQKGIIIMGNEGNGISKEIEPFVSQKLFIPSYPRTRVSSESLNVSTATAIICAEFRRRSL